MNAGGVPPRRLRPMGKLLAEDTRRHHRSLILQHLFAEGPASRADLARATGLTRVTVSDLVGGLIADGLVGELGAPAESKVGKPPTLVGMLAEAAHIVALDLSPDDRMIGAVLDLFGQVKARAEAPLYGAVGADAVGVAVGLASRLRSIAAQGAAARPVLGVGVGTPGVVDGAGVIRYAHNLAWTDVDLTGILRRQLGLPVYVTNDANTAVLAEYTFGGTTAADLMLLRIGIGVGAGLVVGGALVQGHGWSAGEIGHVVVEPGGEPCACGKRGCLETVLSAAHLRSGGRPLASVGALVGQVLAPVVAALNLHEVVLAGPPDLIDGELRKAVDVSIRDRVMTTSAADLLVRMSPHGDDVVLIGAAVLVLSGELGVS